MPSRSIASFCMIRTTELGKYSRMSPSQRAAVGAMTLACSPEGDVLFVGDTDGQVWESRDMGDSWFMIAETGALSKGEFHRGLAKGRPRMTSLDSLRFASAGQKRVDTTRA